MIPMKPYRIPAIVGTALILVGCQADHSSNSGGTSSAVRTAGTQAGQSSEPRGKPQRWDVMTGVDPDAASISATPVATSIEDLGTAQRPEELTGSGSKRFREHRIGKIEHTVWQVRATVQSAESMPDGDYRLILRDEKGNALVCELPDPSLTTKSNRFANQMKTARDHVQRRIHSGDSLEQLGVTATVSGIGYYGRPRGTGAPNGVQLHPVVSVDF